MQYRDLKAVVSGKYWNRMEDFLKEKETFYLNLLVNSTDEAASMQYRGHVKMIREILDIKKHIMAAEGIKPE